MLNFVSIKFAFAISFAIKHHTVGRCLSDCLKVHVEGWRILLHLDFTQEHLKSQPKVTWGGYFDKLVTGRMLSSEGCNFDISFLDTQHILTFQQGICRNRDG